MQRVATIPHPSRAAAGAALLIAVSSLAACRGDAPGPAPDPDAAAVAALPDPEADGLTDLARISRYVYREMALREAECGRTSPLSQRLDYALELAVEGGRIRDVRIAVVSVQIGGFPAPLLPDRWPAGLRHMVDCLRPHLRALEMRRPPRDGSYSSRFSVAGTGTAGGDSAAPAPAAAPGLPDPTETGLPDLVRIARYVFREMHRRDEACSFRNPLPERLGYAFEIEVRGGAIRRAALADAWLDRNGGPEPLPEASWPTALRRYAECLAPYLVSLKMFPAPADGVYRPDYASPPGS